MNKQLSAAAALVCGFVLAGPMTSSVGNAQPICNPANPAHHCIDVVIAGGAIQNPSDVVVPAANHQIYWQIKTSGYKFQTPPQPRRHYLEAAHSR